jgi:branched-chain amino acid aminotransferase
VSQQGKPKYAYFEGKIVPIEEAKISVMTHAFNYGTGVFGGLRGYWNAEEEQLFTFRSNDHFERFIQSASILRIQLPHSPERRPAARCRRFLHHVCHALRLVCRKR